MMKIRYSFIKNKVNSLFIELNLRQYPVDISSIILNFSNCKVISYSRHIQKYNLTEIEAIEHFGSDEGCTIYNCNKNKYLIFYNDLDIFYKKPERRRWTLAHELGHILLSHHTIGNKTKIFRNTLNDDEYKWMEAEANRFASLLLANPLILDKLNIKNNLDIMNICKISSEASIYRYQDYLKWKKHKYINSSDKTILLQFHNFIHKKYCLNCGYGYISIIAKYCPVCGKELLRGDGTMIYNGYELDSKGKAIKCPRCENEEIIDSGSYCKICGTYLINKCTNEECGITLEGNARFCHLCSNESLFYKYGYLKSWEEEQDQLSNTREQIASVIDDDIPF